MKNIPEIIHNNNEEDKEEDNNNVINDDDDDNNEDDCPRQSLPNHTHNDLDVPSRKKIEHPLEMTLVGRWQHCKQLNNW